MITFIPAWDNVSSGEISTDDLIGPIQSLQSTGEACHIVVKDYLPNLRYFLHRFGQMESNYTSIFDQLQGFENLEQRSLRIEDLNFPEFVHYVYTPFSVLVFQEEKQIGEVIMAEGSHISEVRHFENQVLISIEIYDDRGFLSSRKIFEEGKHFLTEYLDTSQSCVFVHFQEDGGCAVNYENTKGLLRKYYESLEALVFERLEIELRQKSAEKIILSVNEKNMSHVSRSVFLERMALSYFNQRVDFTPETQYIHRFLVSQSRAVIADSDLLVHSLNLLTDAKNKIYKISPFDTRFMLSASQEMKNEVLYLDLRNTAQSENKEAILILFEFISERILREERSFKIFIRSNPLDKEGLSNYYFNLIRTRYPNETALIEEFNLDEEGENTLDDSFLGSLKENVALVKQLQKTFEIESFDGDKKLFEILHETRLVLDLASVPDLFTQIAGISTGVPQINTVVSDYVQHQENGWIISSIDELMPVLSHYLDSLKYWQEARVKSVQKIKQYSGNVLSQKLQKLFEGENDV